MRKRVFKNIAAGFNDATEVLLLYAQALSALEKEMILITELKISIQMAALRSQVGEGNFDPNRPYDE